MNKEVKKVNKKLEESLKYANKVFEESRGHLSDSEMLKLLKSLSDSQIKKVGQIVNVISIKASSEGIKNSADLLGKYIQTITNEIVVPYDHFPSEIEIFEINNLVNKLKDDFEVFYSTRFNNDGVVVRFPLYNNDGFKNLEKILQSKYFNIINSEKVTSTNSKQEGIQTNGLKSIHLITKSITSTDEIFIVLDEHFEKPIRCRTKNDLGDDTYIKKLHNIAYMVDVPGKKVPYSKNLSDSINNGLFRKRFISRYMKTNNLKKPTLVQKSESGNILVLKNEVLIKTVLINSIPLQFQSLYIDKTK